MYIEFAATWPISSLGGLHYFMLRAFVSLRELWPVIAGLSAYYVTPLVLYRVGQLK